MGNKGILWSMVFFLSFVIYLVIPTYLIFTFWGYLANYKVGNKPMYTYALLSLFFYAVSLLVALIYIVAGVRAIVQRKNEDGLGIPKGVKGFGLVSTLIVLSFHLIWYFLFNQIFFLILTPPSA